MRDYDDPEHDFIEALKEGDTKRAAYLARQLPFIHAKAKEVLADVLEFKLVPVGRKRGRPSLDATARDLRDGVLGSAVQELIDKDGGKNHEAAVTEASKRYGYGRTVVTNAHRRFLEPRRAVKRLWDRISAAGLSPKPGSATKSRVREKR
jgi:hypothetical protein